jgi:hypothetical protein
MPPEATTKVQEPLTHPGQQSRFRRSGQVFFEASEDVSFIRYLMNLVF